jgi:phage N-6-adenine-methyltransferase
MTMAIQIHPDLQSLIPPLTPEEFAQLEANLLADGCLDPLIVWQEEQVLLDGHHRLAICGQHGLAYHTQEVSLPDLDAAKTWLISHQVGRRNLAPHQLAYFRGSLYIRQKQQGRRTDLTSAQTEQKSLDTATALGRQFGVSAATIRRDGNYAQAVDVITQAIGPTARQALLDREWHLTREEVEHTAVWVQDSPEYVAAVRADLAQQEACPSSVRLQQRAFLHAAHLVTRGARYKECPGCGKLRYQTDAIIWPFPTCACPESSRPDAAAPLVLEAEAEQSAAPAPTWPQTVSSGDYEWYTPPEVLDLVRRVLGTIDVDPASCAAAQAVVGATTYYTVHDDGLRQPWPGRVFLNPPYKMPEIARFIGKLAEELDAGRTTDVILLVNAATETDWFQRAFAGARAVCFPDGRLHFVSPTRRGDSPCQGQALLYVGPHVDLFCVVFAALGVSTRVVCAQATEAQLPLAASHAPTPASLIPERDYCLVHVPPSKQGSADFDPCDLRPCHETAQYHFFTHDARPTGRVWVRRHRLCPLHTEAWCDAQQVDPAAIPTISSAAWVKAYTTGAYDQVPWFRFAAATPAAQSA